MSSRTARFATLFAATVLGVGLATSPAYAGTNTGWAEAVNRNTGKVGGAAEFTSNGDELTVCDQAKDGYSVWGGVYSDEIGELLFSVNNTIGAHTCAGWPENLAEGLHVYVKACLAKAGVIQRATCKTNGGGVA